MNRSHTCSEIHDLAAAFVLDALESDEADAVRAHLATCPESHSEFFELGAVVPALAEMVEPIEPPAGLRKRILAAASADLEAGRPRPLRPPTAPEPMVNSVSTRRWQTSILMRVAAVLVIAALGAWNVLLYGQLETSRGFERDVAAVLDLAASPGSLTAILTSDGGSGAGLAAVDASGRAILALRDLAPTEGDQVYEAWVIAADGVPVPLGSFTVGTGGTARFDATGLPVFGGIVLAITLEPGPGATVPTLPIVTMGAASAAS